MMLKAITTVSVGFTFLLMLGACGRPDQGVTLIEQPAAGGDVILNGDSGDFASPQQQKPETDIFELDLQSLDTERSVIDSLRRHKQRTLHEIVI